MHSCNPALILLLAVLLHRPWVLSLEAEGSQKKMEVHQIQYKGAVLEMVPSNNPLISPLENVLENIRIMTRYAILAKEAKAQIMVFPEQVMTISGPSDRPRYLKYCFSIPDPENDQGQCYVDSDRLVNDPLNYLRCMANTTNMYIVVNVPEKVECNIYRDQNCSDGLYLYNTNVVIDGIGRVVAKYRKERTFDQPQLDKANNEHLNHIFTTNFGVTFGQHTGIEVMYEQPSIIDIKTHSVRDFVMPTNWIDILPFFSAPQVQSSWSQGLGVNLLAAGIHQPGVGSAGSGIYTGASNMANSVILYNDTKGASVLVQDVITNVADVSSSTNLVNKTSPSETQHKPQEVKNSEAQPTPSDQHLFLREILSEVYDMNVIGGITSGRQYGVYKPGQLTDTFAYDVSYDMTGTDFYWLMLYSGVTGVGKCKWHNQVAALVNCQAGESSCGRFPFRKPIDQTIRNLNISATFEVPDIFPSIIDQNFQPVSPDRWTFSKVQNGSLTSAAIAFTEPIESIYAVTLMARWYDRDPECNAN